MFKRVNGQPLKGSTIEFKRQVFKVYIFELLFGKDNKSKLIYWLGP